MKGWRQVGQNGPVISRKIVNQDCNVLQKGDDETFLQKLFEAKNVTTKLIRTDSFNMSGVQAICAEATNIIVARFSSVSTCFWYASDFKCSQKKKSKELRSGERGGQAKCQPRLIHLLEYVASWLLLTAVAKYIGAPSCMSHMLWHTMAGIPCIKAGSRKTK